MSLDGNKNPLRLHSETSFSISMMGEHSLGGFVGIDGRRWSVPSPAGMPRYRRLRQRHAPRSWKSGAASRARRVPSTRSGYGNHHRRFEPRDRLASSQQILAASAKGYRAETDFRRAAPAAVPRDDGRRLASRSSEREFAPPRNARI